MPSQASKVKLHAHTTPQDLSPYTRIHTHTHTHTRTCTCTCTYIPHTPHPKNCRHAARADRRPLVVVGAAPAAALPPRPPLQLQLRAPCAACAPGSPLPILSPSVIYVLYIIYVHIYIYISACIYIYITVYKYARGASAVDVLEHTSEAIKQFNQKKRQESRRLSGHPWRRMRGGYTRAQ